MEFEQPYELRTAAQTHFKIREAANPIEIMRVDWLGQRVTLTNDDGSTVVMRFAEGRWERED